MKISINNYETSSIDLHTIPEDTEDIALYIVEVLGYSESKIDWFVYKTIINH